MKQILYTTLCLIVLGFMACKKDKDSSGVNPDGTITVQSGNELDANAILAIVNDLRTNGCTCNGKSMPAVPVYEWNSELEKAALAHSIDMKNMDKLSHTGSDGSSFSERVKRTAYTGFASSENIAWNYPTEQAVVDGWVSSTKGHCEALMNVNSNEMAIARKGAYWTMVMGKKSQ